MKGFSEEWLRSQQLVLNHETGRYEKQRNLKKPNLEKASSENNELVKSNGQLFIPGDVPSLKNSKQIYWKTTSEKSKSRVVSYMGKRRVSPFITSSKLVKAYEKLSGPYYDLLRPKFLEIVKDLPLPYKIEFVPAFSRNKNMDFNNFNHLITDMMKKHGWINDDDIHHILPFPKMEPPHFIVDKNSPGVYIRVFL